MCRKPPQTVRSRVKRCCAVCGMLLAPSSSPQALPLSSLSIQHAVPKQLIPCTHQCGIQDGSIV
eukprot:7386100-Alexandrium_andersonii.AAC.1